MRKAFLAGGAATAALCVGTNAAVAQTAESTVDEVVVTGSRIARRDYVAESPIVTVPKEVLTNTGITTVGEALNQLPQLNTSISATVLVSPTAGRTSYGQTNPDLRGLGSRRTLVLLDGARLQPSDWFGAVDLNTVPSALLSDVEIITGGASAVYGSDAMAGVINLKTIRNFQGVQFDAQAGITQYGDGENYDMSVTAGTNFADDKGNVVVSVNYHDRPPIDNPRERPWLRQLTTSATGLGSAHGLGRADPALIRAYFGALGYTDPVHIPTTGGSVGINPDGSLYVREGGGNLTGPGSQAGNINFKPEQHTANPAAAGCIGKGPYQLCPYNINDDLVSPLERISLFQRVTYDFSSRLNASVQVMYNHLKTGARERDGNQFYGSPNSLFEIPATNPFLFSSDLPKLFTPAGLARNILFSGRTWMVSSPTIVTYDQYQIRASIGGKLFDDWTWKIHGHTGRTRQHINDENKILHSAWHELQNSPTGGTNICAGGLDLFPLTAISSECRDRLFVDVHSYTTLTQEHLEGELQGGLFELPAGQVRFAAGASYRHDKLNNNPSPLLAPDPARFSPVTGESTASLVSGYGALTTKPSAGFQEAKEVYGELLIPLLKDLPLIKALEADLAFRASDYHNIGTVWTYKASGQWQVASGLLFRGGYQRAIRAPAVGELYAPTAGGTQSFRDIQGGVEPCAVGSPGRAGAVAGVDGAAVTALCLSQGVNIGFLTSAGSTTTILGGNPDLKPEKSSSYTIGAAFRPDFGASLLSNLSASIDYYDITVTGAIGQVPVTYVFQSCYNYNGNNPTYSPDNPYCRDITIRLAFANGLPLGVRTPLVNLAQYQTSGIDFQFDWSAPLADMGLDAGGTLSLNAVFTYLIDYKLQTAPGEPLRNYAGTIGFNQIDGTLSHPHWKGTFTASYDQGRWLAGLRARWIGKASNFSNVANPDQALSGVPNTVYFDLFGRYDLNSRWQLRAGVNNLANQAPRFYSGGVNADAEASSLTSTDRGAYDVLGRRFYLGVRAKF